MAGGAQLGVEPTQMLYNTGYTYNCSPLLYAGGSYRGARVFVEIWTKSMGEGSISPVYSLYDRPCVFTQRLSDCILDAHSSVS